MSEGRLEEKYQAFIKNSSEGIWLCEVDKPIDTSLPADEQVRLMYERAYLGEANDAMARMYGFETAADLNGKRLAELFVVEDPRNTEYLMAFVASGYRLLAVDSHEKDRDGKEHIFRNGLVGVVEGGFLQRAWGTQHDVTDQEHTIKALRESEDRLALALRASGTGMWEWDVASGELIWSDELKRLFGLSPADQVDYERYQSLLHPADRRRVRQTIDESMKTGKEYQMEHRAVWTDGSVHWILGMGKAILENGQPVRMIGTSISMDVMKRRNELETANQLLQDQAGQLLALNKIKDEFIALVSHQLRTPATAVKQYLHLIADGYFGGLQEAQLSALQTAIAGNERQLTIINDLLRVAQLDAGNVVLRKESADVVELLRLVVGQLQSRFDERRQRLTVHAEKNDIIADFDYDRMYMVMCNIIDNAHKYTPPGKDITISVSQDDANTTIKVADQGVGIRQADISKLFQKFSRLEHGLEEEVDGTGLGLYWAHKIVSLHDGDIHVSSRLRRGSTFSISIPNK